MSTQIPVSNLGEEGGVLEGAVTGAHVSLTAFRSRFIWTTDPQGVLRKVVTTSHKPLREQPGEVDFAVSPTISH
jgi:hypothetical protein